MTPAQVAHIMSLVDEYADKYGFLVFHREARAAVEAALRDAPQSELVPESFCAIGYEPEPMERAGAIGLVAMSIPQPSAPTAVKPEERLPLTVEQIEPLAASVIGYLALLPEEMKLFTDCVRAVEAAHGIAARASKGTK